MSSRGPMPARSLSSPRGRREATTTRTAHDETKTAPAINNPRSNGTSFDSLPARVLRSR